MREGRNPHPSGVSLFPSRIICWNTMCACCVRTSTRVALHQALMSSYQVGRQPLSWISRRRDTYPSGLPLTVLFWPTHPAAIVIAELPLCRERAGNDLF